MKELAFSDKFEDQEDTIRDSSNFVRKPLKKAERKEDDPLAELKDMETNLNSDGPEAGGSIRDKAGD